MRLARLVARVLPVAQSIHPPAGLGLDKADLLLLRLRQRPAVVA